MATTQYLDRVDIICLREFGEVSSDLIRALLRENPQLGDTYIIPAHVEYTVPDRPPARSTL